MDTTMILLLAAILIILIILNYLKDRPPPEEKDDEETASCSQTAYGCCPDGVNSKINYYGTNCPAYNPGPGYHPRPPPPPAPGPVYRKPIGGCAGTQYGCCPDQRTAKIDTVGSNCLVH